MKTHIHTVNMDGWCPCGYDMPRRIEALEQAMEGMEKAVSAAVRPIFLKVLATAHTAHAVPSTVCLECQSLKASFDEALLQAVRRAMELVE